jgi:hypothetical protein
MKTGRVSSRDRFFAEGFDLGGSNDQMLEVVGSEYRPNPKRHLMADPAFRGRASWRFDFSGADIENASMIDRLNTTFRVSPSLITGPAYIPIMTNGNAANFNFFVHESTGSFLGSSRIRDLGIERRVEFFGFYAPGVRRGGGYFKVYDLPIPPFRVGTTPLRTGLVHIEPTM